MKTPIKTRLRIISRRMRRFVPRALRYAWAFPATALGLLIGLVGWFTGSRFVVRNGVLEMWGGGVSWYLRVGIPGIGEMPAMALGHTILARDRKELKRWRKHELVHVKQYERWGPALIPTLLLHSVWLKITGGDPYYDNPFEREAYGTVPYPKQVAWRNRRAPLVAALPIMRSAVGRRTKRALGTAA